MALISHVNYQRFLRLVEERPSCLYTKYQYPVSAEHHDVFHLSHLLVATHITRLPQVPELGKPNSHPTLILSYLMHTLLVHSNNYI